MRELEIRLRRLRQSADATVFALVDVSPELKARVLRATLESPAQAPAPSLQRERDSQLSSPWMRRLALPSVVPRLAAGAAVVALAAFVAVAVWPHGGRAEAAPLTVVPAGSERVVSVSDPHARAGGEVVALPFEVGVEAESGVKALPVEIDTASSLTYRWSPDGRRLVYGNRGDLHVYDTETGTSTNITDTPGSVELLPSWSPDGTRIAFTSRLLQAGEGPSPDAPADPDWVLVGVFGGSPAVVSVDGDAYRVLEKVTVTSAPSWSADGRTLAYATDGVVEGDVPETRSARVDGAIHLADVESGRVRKLTPEPGRGAGYVGAASWSPTRSELAIFFSESDRFPSRSEILAGSAPRVRQGYALLDPESGEVSVVHAYEAPFVPRGPAAWSDDGDLLALLFRQETAIDDPVALLVVTRTGDVTLRLPGLFAHVVWEPGQPRLAARSDGDAAEVILASVREGGAVVSRLRFDSEIQGVAWRPIGR